ncbi:MAG: class I SAM-dependent methyltransferase [Nocardioides sp.]|uniref:class I SAM-dependent methyltransferase n=1 Tax=Nocardioides sp. TaxID=35761 RepID=UPI0039E572F2
MSTAVSGADIDDDGLLVPGDFGALVLWIEDRYLWSLTPHRDGTPTLAGWRVEWPPVLLPYLNGQARMRLTDVSGEAVLFDAPVSLGSGEGQIEIVDRAGHPLCVDKVGHLARAFEATGIEIRAEILRGTQRALRDLREHAGVEAYLNYGALLGAVREDRMLAHDSDTDLCYLSRHTSPADIITESYAVERVMRRRGWRLLRMSGGDVKLLLPLSDGRLCHIDVFVAFYVADGVGGERFFQLGNRSGRLPRDVITPVATRSLHGVEFVVPARPEAMLAFVYGPHWRVPDPSFRYADPPEGIRRLDGWLRGFRTTMGAWSTFHRVDAVRVPNRRSAFARWVERDLPAGSAVLDLGTGTGRDARFFARNGRTVHAVDFSRIAVSDLRLRTRRAVRRGRLALSVDQLILGELRSVLQLGARIAREPYQLYARDLLGCLDDAARTQLWQLARMGCRPHGGRLYLDFPVGDPRRSLPAPPPEGLNRRLDADRIRAEVERAGGVVEQTILGPAGDQYDDLDPQRCWMRVWWPPLPGSKPTMNLEER